MENGKRIVNKKRKGVPEQWQILSVLMAVYDFIAIHGAFLLALPLARKGREYSLNTGDFLFRKAKRLLPGFWFIILVFFFFINFL